MNINRTVARVMVGADGVVEVGAHAGEDWPISLENRPTSLENIRLDPGQARVLAAVLIHACELVEK